MIKINLLGSDSHQDHSGHLFIAGYAASVLVAAGVCFFLGSTAASEVDALTGRRTSLEAELKRVQKTTEEVRQLEKTQKDLSERLVRIAMLKKSKQGPVKVLDALNKTIPEKAWLTEVREKGGTMKIAGFALDGQTVANFVRDLEQSEHFPQVLFDVTRQAVRQGVKIQEFSLKATVSYGGKIQPVSVASAEPAKAAKKES